METISRVEVADILRARDARVVRQQAFLQQYGVPLVSFTMNIAGDIKCDVAIRRAFYVGMERICRAFLQMDARVLKEETVIAFTGCEALFAVDAPAQALKARMCCLEEEDALGRLFDVDVIDAQGVHLSRGEERKCLLCDAPARVCARSRAHSAEELFARAQTIIAAHFDEKYSVFVGECAQRALLHEALTTPKPGLVDCEDCGAHRDMDLFSFADSACALRPYFEKCARLGQKDAGAQALQAAGLDAEEQMLRTAKANTHKGAIFALGILCYAAGKCGENAQEKEVFSAAAALGETYLGQMKSAGRLRTGGEKQYRAYGLTGARGEAAGGYKSVQDVALPRLRAALKLGKALQAAGREALIALIAHVQDSNIIRRAGTDGQRFAMQEAEKTLAAGCDEAALRQMNKAFVEKNISPGGSADLLAAAYFMHFLQKREE